MTTDTIDTHKSNITDYSVSDISLNSSESDFMSKDNKYFSDTNSIDSFFDTKSIDTYLNNNNNNNNNKKNVKFNKIVESINYDDCSRDDNNIFEHIKKCNNCKNKLLKFLNNTSDNENKCKYSKIFDYNINKSLTKKDYNINKSLTKKDYNIKEIIIFILTGIFIIIMLDILLRYKN
jgi:hypothetical protein